MIKTKTQYKLFNGDCLKIMPTIEAGSVDLVLADPPYGTTSCSWDTVIPFDLMWFQIKRLRKERAAVALFGSEPFSSLLRVSNLAEFKYDIYQKKERGTGFMTSNKRPLMIIDCISVFYANQPTYNPQRDKLKNPYTRHKPTGKKARYQNSETLQGKGGRRYEFSTPTQFVSFPRKTKGCIHPTQKPVALLEYIIKTYTQPGDTVLDFTMGSGATGVACMKTGRSFIGIELGLEYFKIARARIKNINGEFVYTDKETNDGQLPLFPIKSKL